MSLKKRLITIGVIACGLAAAIFFGVKAGKESDMQLLETMNRDTIEIWYADDSLTDYLNSVALSYQENTGVKVLPILHSGLEYLEEINDASVRSDEIPDLFVVSNDSLEKAYQGGLAVAVSDPSGVCTTANYPQTALDSVTYNDKILGYPFYFETSVLLYNRTYMENFAKETIEAESDVAAGEEAQADVEAAEAATTEVATESDEELAATKNMSADELNEAIDETIDVIIPSSIDDILTFADEYDAPDEVQSVFNWDVTDIFYNYFFVGNYINVGGQNGDDSTQIDIYNEDAMKCLQVYQDLNQFFSIDTKEVSYDSILQDFIDGKIVFTVATSDCIAKLEEAKKNNEFNYEYGITTLPDVSTQLQSRGLSVTNAVVVNGYSKQKDLANDFATYLAYDEADSLYDRTGKVSAKAGVTYENEMVGHMMDEYEKSVPMPKMLETSNFWVQLEVAFSEMWNGADINDTLKVLSEQIMTQITGEEYKEDYIDLPEEETTEYSDESMSDITSTDKAD